MHRSHHKLYVSDYIQFSSNTQQTKVTVRHSEGPPFRRSAIPKVSSIRVSRVGRVSRVRVTLTVTVRVSRVSVMVSVRDSVK